MEKAKKIILLFGARGMLGQALAKRLSQKYKIIALEHSKCDVADFKQVARMFSHYQPWLALNAAALTNVDACEDNPKKARAVNARGAYNIAKAAGKYNSIVVQISTDYVFSGGKDRPYQENNPAHPVNIYGKTKLEGEIMLRKTLKKHVIIRTSWLFGEGKDNFINHILERSQKEAVLRIADDKYSSPTYTLDLAQAIVKIINLINDSGCPDSFYGTYHISNSGYCSWYEYAKVILRAAKVNQVKLEPIKMSQINFQAKRPVFSALDNTKYSRLTGKPLRKWQEAVKDYIKREYM